MISMLNKTKMKILKKELISFIKNNPACYNRLFLKEEKVNKNKILKNLLTLLVDSSLVRVSENKIIPKVRINFIKDKILICTDLCSYNKENQVFPVHAEQLFLIDNLNISKNDTVLELGAGSGAISIFAALKGKKIIAAEISPRAINFAKFNCTLNNLENKIQVVKSNWFSKLRGMKFDVIFSNPPFEPTPKGIKHFYHSGAGEDGLDVIRSFLPMLKTYLKPGGKLQLVTYSIFDRTFALVELMKDIDCKKELIVLPQSIPLLEFMKKYPLTKKLKESYKQKKIYLVVMNLLVGEKKDQKIIKISKKDSKKYGDILFVSGMGGRGVTIPELDLLKKVQKKQEVIKSKSPKNTPLKKIPWSDTSPTLINGKPSKRVMVIIAAKGCAWAKRGSGPCTMCNFWFVCSKKASNSQIVELFKKEVNKYDFQKEGIEEIDIFNAGSFLNNAEISREAAKKIMKIISGIKPIKKVMIESRPEYINEKKIKELKKILGGKELEVGIGLESSDDFVREVLINKGFNLNSFKNAVKIIKESGATLFAYALVKPIFLTEKEAIEDAVNTIKYIFLVGRKFKVKTRVALEPVFIKPHTLVYELYNKKVYSHVWLWSIIEILKQTSKLGNIQVGLSLENMAWHEMPRNCRECSGNVTGAIKEFNKSQKVKVFNMLSCKCQKDWHKEIAKKSISLRERVEKDIK